MRSGGQILIDGLIQYGVNTAFCVPGESYLGALDAMYQRSTQIRLITCRQEGGAAYMAEAWGKLTDQPGVVFVSRGPGTSNAMIGIHTAFQDSTPLICFVGQISRRDRGREAFQELNYHQALAGVAKKVIDIDNATRIPEQLNQAWQQATTGRPGPVIVVLYEDMLKDEVEVADIVFESSSDPKHFPASPSSTATEKVQDLLAAAKRPLVICGDSSWDSECAELVARFAEQQQLPIATAFRRQDSIDNKHPHYVGELGLVAPQSLVDYLYLSDLLLVVGPRLGDITTQGYTLLQPPHGIDGQKLVHVHSAAEEINAVYRADFSIVSDSKAFLEAMVECGSSSVDRNEIIDSLNREYLSFVTTPRPVENGVRMDRVMEYLRDRLPDDSIITNGAGNYTTWPQRHYHFRLANTQLAPTNGSMGYGVPAAVAAQLARPGSIVVSFSGDGCFLMNGQEVATAVQYRLPILFLVINNNQYGTIRSHQERHYPGRVIGTDLVNPDFAALGQAFGANGYIVKETGEFEAIFEEALAADGPAVIEIVQAPQTRLP